MAGQVALRWARALTLASVMLCAGYSGHLTAGGVAPPPALLGPMLVVVTVAVAPFLDRPASATRVVVLMLAGQACLHVALNLVGGAASASAAPMVHTAAGPGMAGMVPGDPWSSSSILSTLCLTGTHLNMLLAHVGAALVVALWLAAGERAAWTLVAVTTLVVARTWSALCGACVVPAVLVTWTRPRALLARIDQRRVMESVWDGCRALSQRGPPRLCAA
jgi:hypothetical protein